MSGSQRLKKAMPLVVPLIVLAAGAFVGSNVGSWLSAPDSGRRVDVLVVTAGDANRRIPQALDLLERKRVGAVWVLASAPGPVIEETKAVESYVRSHADNDDVRILRAPKGSIRKDKSVDLVREAVVVRGPLRRAKGVENVAVLSPPLEIARTRLAFERTLGRDVSIWSDQSRYNAQEWWTKDALSTAVETVKYLSALALLGPGPEELRSGSVPIGLPLRALVGGILIAAAAGAICRPLARRLGLVSIPRLWRAHTTPTPMLGGLAILAGLAGGILVGGGVRLGALGAAAGAGVVVLAVVGLIDDIAGLGAAARLLWAGGAGAIAWLLGLRALVFTGGEPLADVTNAAVTVLWFVGVTFALNNLDNLDGVTAGVGTASALAIAAAAALGGQIVVTVAAAALAGACLGYLVHNMQPARLFMGDMGTLAIGFALASLALALRPHPNPPLSMAVPILVLGVPIFDTTMVSISRLRSGSRPHIGGTDHTSHRLLARGMSARQSAAAHWVAQLVLGIAAVAIARSQATVGWALVALVAVTGVASLLLMLRLPPWSPPWQLEVSGRVIGVVERAMNALQDLERAVSEEGLRLSDPQAARSAEETLKRLERVQRLLETPREPPTEA